MMKKSKKIGPQTNHLRYDKNGKGRWKVKYHETNMKNERIESQYCTIYPHLFLFEAYDHPQ